MDACIPTLAFKALSTNPGFSLLMPYSVVVAEQTDGSIAVSLGQPSALFKAMEWDDIDGFAEMVRRPLQAAMDALSPP